MCDWLKKIFGSNSEIAPQGEYTGNTIVGFFRGDYAGDANDLAGPPYDQKDFYAMINKKWPYYSFRTFLDFDATAKNLLSELKLGVNNIKSKDDLLLTINDNCFSTSNTRDIPNHNPKILGYRYHPHPVLPPRGKTRTRALTKAGNYIAMSACLDNETAADAYFKHPNGAYHYCLIMTAEVGITYLEWHQRTLLMLKQLRFNQTCTIETIIQGF